MPLLPPACASACLHPWSWRGGSRFTGGRVRIGEKVLLYSDVHLETQGDASIELGQEVEISRGTHIVAMAGITIGYGS